MTGPTPSLDLRHRWAAARTSREGRRSLWSGLGLVGSSLAAAASVVIAARALGTAQYGVYAGIGAFVNLAAMFAGMGTKEVLLQRVTRDRSELPAAWGVLLGANAVVGLPLLAVTIGVAITILPGRDVVALALIGAAEYVSAGLLKAPAQAWVSLDRFGVVAAINIGDATLRLAAAATLLLGDGGGLRRLAVALAVAMALGAVAVNLHLLRTVGRPRLDWRELLDGCRVGAPFSITSVSGAVQSNIDQFMLVRARLDVDAGLYAAGVRFVGYGMLPFHARVSAAIPEFFRLGHDGAEVAFRYGRRILPQLVGISLAGAVLAIVVARPMGALFGDRFDGVLAVVVALALFPPIRAFQVVHASALLASGNQRLVARLQVATAALNVAINILLIPWLGWRGAVVSTYLSELVNLGLLWVWARAGAVQRRRPVMPVAVDSPVETAP